MNLNTKTRIGLASAVAALAIGSIGGPATARQGADDAPGHIRQSRGADDAPGHISSHRQRGKLSAAAKAAKKLAKAQKRALKAEMKSHKGSRSHS